MTDGYIRKLEFSNEVYLPDCPIALEKGAILLDTKTDAYFLQLKFANIGMAGISSVRICVESFDGTGQLAYPETTVTYDEYTVVGGTFGTKKLLPIPNNNASAFRVYVDCCACMCHGDSVFVFCATICRDYIHAWHISHSRGT